MVKKVQLQDLETSENIYPLTGIDAVDGLEDRLKAVEDREDKDTIFDPSDIEKRLDALESADSYDDTELREKIEEIEDALFETNGMTVEYVDLGLPSGLLWATCNLGAEKETDYGLYFQWGDTKGYKGACSEAESTEDNKETHYFGWSKYKHCNGSQYTLTKYCDSSLYGNVDNKTILEPEDDAAITMLGNGWRMPTKDEFQELIDNTEPGDGANNRYFIENYNNTRIAGSLLKSKINGNTIFFPAFGHGYNNNIHNIGIYGRYFTNLLNNSYSYQSQAFETGVSGIGVYPNDRQYGFQVRPVTSSVPTNKQPKFQPYVPGGEPGQVLTKTDDGVIWGDIEMSSECEELNKDELDLIFFEPKMNTIYIKVYNTDSECFKYYLGQDYIDNEHFDIENEIPIGYSMKTDNLPDGFTVGFQDIILNKYENVKYDEISEMWKDITTNDRCEDVLVNVKDFTGDKLYDAIPPAGYTNGQYKEYCKYDYNGKEYTKYMLDVFESLYPELDWKNVDKLDSKLNGVPAAAIWRYFTPGTNKGDWYIPSTGELYEFFQIFKKINYTPDRDIIKKVNCHYEFYIGSSLTSSYGSLNKIGGTFCVTLFGDIFTYSNGHTLAFSSF